MKVFSDTIFTADSVKQQQLSHTEFEGCTFKGCDFSNADFSESIFSECVFENCNLSMAKLRNASLRDVLFKACKMLGLHFDDCIPAGLVLCFESCTLNHSAFTRLKLKKMVFRNTQLQEVDFAECDMTACVLDNCDLHRAAFAHTVLEQADLRTSYGYNIDPEANRLKGAKFALPEVLRLLDKYNIVVER